MRRTLKTPESPGHYKGKLSFEEFVTWCLNRLRIGTAYHAELLEDILEESKETNRLLRMLANEDHTERGLVDKVKDLIDDGKLNNSNKKNYKSKKE